MLSSNKSLSLLFIFILTTIVYSTNAEGVQKCCSVYYAEIAEMPNPSNQVYAVSIPSASYKISSKIAQRNLRRISGKRPTREQTMLSTDRFFWSNPMNDTSTIYLLVLPEGDGTVIYGVLKTDQQEWVEPESGSQALFFANYLKELGESIYHIVIEDELSDLKKERRKLQSKIKRNNRQIKKQRKRITRYNNEISQIREEISMLQTEQGELSSDITQKRLELERLKGEDRKAYRALKKEKNKKQKSLNKKKKAEEKLHKDILDQREKIDRAETEIRRIQDERRETETDIENLRNSRRQLRGKLNE
ncbi:MAG: hypothetical protein EA358_07040 [Flavobacteriales bacterium]|nr:MAG: hypothetical protein EA358_07040 [Flavobacteriales bacterium]